MKKLLNERQQKALIAIYRSDQIAEENEKSKYRRGWQKEKADIWRRMQYPDNNGWETFLHRNLREAGVIDYGLGSTLNSLCSRELIECAYYTTIRNKQELLWIKLTNLGRKTARELLGESAPKKPPKGQLRERQWKALELAYKCGDEGVYKDENFNYGGFSWEWTWLRLRDYYGVNNGLIKESSYSVKRKAYHDGWETSVQEYKIVITENGKIFYEDNCTRYEQLYSN
jgi:hypothetical protein